jgi:hypothetical protein
VGLEVALGDRASGRRRQVLDRDGTGGALVGSADDRDADAATVGVLELLAELEPPPPL